jgi:hypothetical protein
LLFPSATFGEINIMKNCYSSCIAARTLIAVAFAFAFVDAAALKGSGATTQGVLRATARGDLQAELEKQVTNDFLEHSKKTGGKPAFANLGINAEDMAKSIIMSILQVHQAPSMPGMNLTPWDVASAASVFNQADRQSCSVTALAAGMSVANPLELAKAITQLYWEGTFPAEWKGKGMPNPCPYILELNPNEDTNCPDCMQGAEFVWATSTRDSRNQDIGGYGCDNVADEFRVTVQPQDGKVFLAVPDDEVWWCNIMYGKTCKLDQGSKACTDNKVCSRLLDHLTPIELAALKAWAVAAPNQGILFGGQNGALTQYTGQFPNVKKVAEHPNLGKIIVEYYTPVPVEDIKAACNTKHGAMIALDEHILQHQCQDNSGMYGCNFVTAGCPVQGQSPCMSNHWVYLRDCDGDTVNIWSWGAIFRMSLKTVAGITTTVIPIPV